MADLLSVFEYVISANDFSPSQKFNYLLSCEAHQAFSSESVPAVKPVISTINRKLDAAAERNEGLRILKVVLPQCSTPVFLQHSIQWLNICLRILQDVRRNVNDVLLYSVIGILLKESLPFSELSREISTSVVPSLVHSIMLTSTCTIEDENVDCILSVLSVCMKLYPGAVVSSREKVSSLLKNLFPLCNNPVSSRFVDCFALLPNIAGGGKDGQMVAWKTMLHNLVATLHTILDKLYEGQTELETYNISGVPLDISYGDDTPTSQVYVLMKNFQLVLAILSRMMSIPSDLEKPLHGEDILGVVCRTLALNCQSLSKQKSHEAVLLSSVIPDVHISVLDFLCEFMKMSRTLLYSYSNIIPPLLVQSLKYTKSDNRKPGRECPFGKLRSVTYSSLQLWCQLCKSGSGLESFMNDLLSEIVYDIKPFADVVKLKSLPKPEEITIKKRTGKGKKSSIHVVEALHEKVDQKANYHVCREALLCATLVIRAAGTIAKPQIHKELQETVLSTLLLIQQSGLSRPVPYSDPVCRQELYRLLLTLVVHPHPNWPPPTHYASVLVRRGLMDPNVSVSSSCWEISSVLDTLVHPRAPTLQYPVTATDVKRVLVESGQVTPTEEEDVPVGIGLPGSVLTSDGDDDNEEADTPSLDELYPSIVDRNMNITNNNEYEEFVPPTNQGPSSSAVAAVPGNSPSSPDDEQPVLLHISSDSEVEIDTNVKQESESTFVNHKMKSRKVQLQNSDGEVVEVVDIDDSADDEVIGSRVRSSSLNSKDDVVDVPLWGKSATTETNGPLSAKRVYSDDHEPAKRSKIEQNSRDIEEMLADFVDASPDDES